MIDKRILSYDKKLLTAWLRVKAGCSFPEYFNAHKGECGLELQQVPEEYVELLMWFKEQNFKNYLELDVGRGGSFLLNCMFQPELVSATAVDNCEYWNESQKEDIEKKIQYLNCEKDGIVKFINSSTDEFFKTNSQKYDCIFIDADHSFEGVKKDYENAIKCLNPDGYIIFHDINSSQCPGVVQIFQEASKEHEAVFKAVNGNNCGIGVIRITSPYKLENITGMEKIINGQKCGVVIVETRRNHGLHETIENCYKFLDWPVMVFCSEANQNECVFDKKVVLRKNTLDMWEYNKMLTSTLFWDIIPFDKVLIMQTDGAIRRKGIEEFMGYDYVGAPWTWNKWGGNGGVSLRTVSVMRNICAEFRYDNGMDGNEDVFFCKYLNNLNKGKLAPREVCMRFGSEAVYSEDPLTYHAIEKYLSPEQVKKLKA